MTQSARGLFRATGKKSKPVAVRNLMGEIIKTEALEREKDEFYPTPAAPTRAILAAELPRLRQFSSIWECACGDGAMVREMESVGLTVIASDIVDRGLPGAGINSFYDFKAPPSKAIVTNPPYAECNERDGQGRWIWYAVETLGIEYMALLLNWSWPGAGGHDTLWAKHPPARVYLMRWKIDFTGQGAPPMLNGWFVWDKEHQGETILRMLDRKDPRQGEML